MKQTEQQTDVAVLFSILRPDDMEDGVSLEELESLVETANGWVAAILFQKRDRPESGTYFGAGKLAELKQTVIDLNATIAICNDELTPSQQKRLQDILDVRVIDRTQLILDIFARRARSKEGKLQVELAQLKYTLPRLTGMGAVMSRLGGGIGTRGPGETKLETDRRHIRRRIRDIEKKLNEVVAHRQRYRERRRQQQAFQLALVGYTNAGKSTLFSRLTDQETLVEDQLFATLDPLTKQCRMPSSFHCLVSDTVGFIRDLPTTLIAAFRSTLEEAAEADALLFVVDGSDDERLAHERTVFNLLKQLELDHLPVLTIYNKMDQVNEQDLLPVQKPCIFTSGIHTEQTRVLKKNIEQWLGSFFDSYVEHVSADDGKRLDLLKRHTIMTSLIFNEDEDKYEVRGYKPAAQ
ncbi:GTPase HflX [Bacillaceae bacterium SIJ1]|uniref:GTPase HflX n=1 Tax=Litoribacterium kuwaitense TaxID=1398745 RepID=UPI0013EC6F6E|nr:GTPase HflX [Litoribacterium kuwaitense]NGP44051.1 GTPase HflX [Litoribacterium kuwaitense]